VIEAHDVEYLPLASVIKVKGVGAPSVDAPNAAFVLNVHHAAICRKGRVLREDIFDPLTLSFSRSGLFAATWKR